MNRLSQCPFCCSLYTISVHIYITCFSSKSIENLDLDTILQEKVTNVLSYLPIVELTIELWLICAKNFQLLTKKHINISLILEYASACFIALQKTFIFPFYSPHDYDFSSAKRLPPKDAHKSSNITCNNLILFPQHLLLPPPANDLFVLLIRAG